MTFTTAVIGAGAAGVAASLALRGVGSIVTCFEVTDKIGGVWNYNGATGGAIPEFASSVYCRSLTPFYPSARCVMPKDMMAFSDLRFSFLVPQFPHYGAIQQYLQDYACRRGMQSITRFNTLVEQVQWDESRRQWSVRTVNVRNGDVMAWWFDSVVVASGRYHRARLPTVAPEPATPTNPNLGPLRTMPPVPGQRAFEDAGGVVLHSSDLKQMRDFNGKVVVVVGRGVAAAEAVRELRRQGAFAVHSPSLATGATEEPTTFDGEAGISQQLSADGRFSRGALTAKYLFGAGRYDESASDTMSASSSSQSLIAHALHLRNRHHAPLSLVVPSPQTLRRVMQRRRGATAPSATAIKPTGDVDDTSKDGVSTATAVLPASDDAFTEEWRTYATCPGQVRMPSLGPLEGFSGGVSPQACAVVGDDGAYRLECRRSGGEKTTALEALDARCAVMRFPKTSAAQRLLGSKLSSHVGGHHPTRLTGQWLLRALDQRGVTPESSSTAANLGGWSPLRRQSLQDAAKEAAIEEILDVAEVRRVPGVGGKGGTSRAAETLADDNWEAAVVVRNVAAIVFCTGYYSHYPFLEDSYRNDAEYGSRYPVIPPKLAPAEPSTPATSPAEAAARSDAQPAASEQTRQPSTTERPAASSSPLLAAYDKRPSSISDLRMLYRRLYLGAVHQANPTLAFMGMPANLLPPFLLMEAQARFIAYVFARRIALPSTPEKMERRELLCHGLDPRALARTSGCGVSVSAIYYDALLKEIAGQVDDVAAMPRVDGPTGSEAVAAADATGAAPSAASTNSRQPPTTPTANTTSPTPFRDVALLDEPTRTAFHAARLRSLRRSPYWDHIGWQRVNWYAGTSFISALHKVRSFAPLRRREQHVIVSNEI